MNSATTLPVIDPVNPTPIPSLLKNSSHWVLWQAGTIQPNGKFAKYPVHPDKGYKVDAHQATNQMSFDTAMHAAQYNKITGGIGYVMTGTALTRNEADEPLYLVGIDIDEKAGMSDEQLHDVWTSLGKPYVEVSPSKKGVRMFCLSTDLIDNRNQNGLEMYSSKRFLTVTGWAGKGLLKDCTVAINALHTQWFTPPVKAVQRTISTIVGITPETPRNIAWAEEVLAHISPDCDYEQYRNVIWGVQALGWTCGESLQRQ